MPDFYDTEKNFMSKFNEASLKLLRLNEMQVEINRANINLLRYNEEQDMYNFEIKFNALGSLFEEVSAQLNPKELEEGRVRIKEIENQMEEEPVFKRRQNMLTHKMELELNKKNWKKLRGLLLDFTLMIKGVMKSHGISLPESDDPSRAAYR